MSQMLGPCVALQGLLVGKLFLTMCAFELAAFMLRLDMDGEVFLMSKLALAMPAAVLFNLK